MSNILPNSHVETIELVIIQWLKLIEINMQILIPSTKNKLLNFSNMYDLRVIKLRSQINYTYGNGFYYRILNLFWW